MPIAKYLQNVKSDPRVTPGALSAVIQAESGGDPNAVSPKGATGLAQLMPGTARDLGVDPLNPAQAKEGAARYLNYLIGQTGDLKSALAAYNFGLGNWKKSGGVNLPKETVDYVKKVMGLLSKREQGLPPPTIASAPVNPQDPTPQDTKTESAPTQVASAAPGPTPQFSGYGKISNPPSQFLGKENPIAMVQALLQDPTSLSRGEGRANMAGGGAVKGVFKDLAESIRGYHGTTSPMSGSRLDPLKYHLKNDPDLEYVRPPDQYLGPHFANSQNLAERFAKGEVRGVDAPLSASGGSMKGVDNLFDYFYYKKNMSPMQIEREFPGVEDLGGSFSSQIKQAKNAGLNIPKSLNKYAEGGGGAVYPVDIHGKVKNISTDVYTDYDAIAKELGDQASLKFFKDWAGKAHPQLSDKDIGLIYKTLQRNVPVSSEFTNEVGEIPSSVGEFMIQPGSSSPIDLSLGQTIALVKQYRKKMRDEGVGALSYLNTNPEEMGGLDPLSYVAHPDAVKYLKPITGYAGGGAVKGALGRIAKMLGGDEIPAKLQPLQAVKEQGGQWLPGSAKDFTGDVVAGRAGDNEEARNWALKSVPKYIERYMGAKGDPLADVQIPHGQGTARWEDLTDPLVKQMPAGKAVLPEMNENAPDWMKNLPPETPIHNLAFQAPGKTNVQDYISHVLDHAATLPPEKLKNYDFPRLVQEVQKIDADRAAKMSSVESRMEGTVPHKEYPTGFKWVEVQSPEALKNEGDIMGHCVGGYCDAVKSGQKKIYSLRDPKGESHVTVEASSDPSLFDALPNRQNRLEARYYSGPIKEFWGATKQYLQDNPVIRQIKGKQNLAPKPEYQPYIQDLIRSGQWGDVRNLENAGLTKIEEAYPASFKFSKEAADKAKDKFGQYISGDEMEDYLRTIGAPTGIPQMKEGGAVIRSAPRNKFLGALSDAINGADEHILKPVQEYAEKAPGINELLNAGLGLPLAYQYLTGDKPKPLSWLVPRLDSLGKVVEDASYGMPLTTGKGMTTGFKPEVGFAALDAAQLPNMARGVASIGKGIKPLAAKLLPKRAAPDVIESMFGPEKEWAAAKNAWDSAQGFAGGGAVKGALGRIAKMLGGEEIPAKLQPLQAVKEQGGQWLPGSSQRFVKGPTSTVNRSEESVAPHEAWASKAIPKYVERYMGAKGDPLANIEIPHGQGTYPWEKLTDPIVRTDSLGRLLTINPERPDWMKKLPSDTSIYSVEDRGGNVNSVRNYISHVLDHAATLPPEKLKNYDFPRLVQEVQKIDADRAAKMAAARVGKEYEVPKYKEYPEGYHWAELKVPEGGLTPAHLERVKEQPSGEYHAVDPEGKLIFSSAQPSLRAIGKTPEEAFTAGRLIEEGNTMGHCVGGYCKDVMGGRKKIYSLRDPKGQSHATVEVAEPLGPSRYLTPEERELRETKLRNEGLDLATGDSKKILGVSRSLFPELFYPNMNQIKGKQNLAPKPEYQPYIQDLIRSGQWNRVDDLENSGLKKLGQEVKAGDVRKGFDDPSQVKALQEKYGDYITQQELDDYLKSIGNPQTPMKEGGPVKKVCKGGMTCPCLKCSKKRFEKRA